MRGLVILGLVFGLLASAGSEAANDIRGTIRVIDGDTIDVGATRVRLHGIDAVENDQTCRTEQGVAWDCGRWVRAEVHALYAGKRALCQPVTRDRYGRIVARCVVEGVDMGGHLVSEGLAIAYRRYARDYVEQERQAARADRGLHAVLFQSPAQYRQTRAVGRLPPNAACRIKGNISGSGERIYHSPGQRDYERTGIRPENGERWFCSAAEAEAAGWRAARR